MTTIDWQPIETAPKDRTVMLWVPDGVWSRATFGEWDDEKYARKPKPYWNTELRRWRGVIWQRAHQPTHWAPIPEGPR